MKEQLEKYYPLLPLLLLCFFYAWRAVDFPVHDFSNYYFGGKFLADGVFTSKIYFPYEFNKAISDLGYRHIFVNYAPNSPFTAVLFLPFSLVSAGIAKIIFNCFSIGWLAFGIYRLFSFYKINPKFTLLVPLLFFIPIKNTLLFGQVYFLLFFLLSEGWIAHEKKQFRLMALFWGLAMLLKVFPAILFLPLLFKKQWKPLFYLALSCFLLFGISILITGIDIWLFYLKEVLPKASNGEISTAFVTNYQSVFMFAKQFWVYDPIENQNVLFRNPIVFPTVMLVFKIAILVIGYFIVKKVSNAFVVFSYWILAMILLSPYGSTYTMILLLFPFFALLKSEISKVGKVLFCAILILINNLPLSLFIKEDFPFSYLRLLLLLLLFALFLVYFWQKANWKTVAAFYLIPLILVFVFKPKQNPLLNNLPILIYDYKFNKKGLTYFYWNENGKNEQQTNLTLKSVVPLEIRDNQIFYLNRQLTFDGSHKLKPILMNGETVLYLSDYGRGIGFYTPKTIELH